MKKFTRLPAVVFLYLFFLFLPSSNTAAQVSGVKAIPGDYASITDAVAQIRITGVSGPTFLELQPGYNSASETFPIIIREMPGVHFINTLTISPASGATGLSIVSATNGPVIYLIGATGIIIDGRPGRSGTARELTIRNNANDAHAISFTDGAIDNIVRYCTVEGDTPPAPQATYSGGIIYFGPSLEPLPFNTLFENAANEVSNCIIRGINSPTAAILCVANDAVRNLDNKIINNEIIMSGGYGIALYNYNRNWTITGNSIYSPNGLGLTDVGILFGQSAPGSNINNTISGNFIGGTAPQAGGNKALVFHSVHGIILYSGTFIVENNVIQNFRIRMEGGQANFEGMRIFDNASVQISRNQIGGTTPSSNIQIDPGNFILGTATIRGITNLSCLPVAITNNRISNILFFGYTTATFTGILHNGGDNLVIAGNLIDQISANGPGSVVYKAISLTPNPICPFSPNPSAEIDRNLINNITLTSDDGNASFTGIELGGTNAVSEPAQLHNNEISKLNISAQNGEANVSGLRINDRISSNTGNIIGSPSEANSIIVTGKTAHVTAILVNESPDASISDDLIGNITVNGTLSSSLNGIYFQGGGIAKAEGNELKNLSVKSTGPADMVGVSFNGTNTSSEPSLLHHNQIYSINVSSTNAEASFAGIRNDRLAANTGNIIGSASEANSIVVTGKSAHATGIHLKNPPDVSVSDDVIANISAIGTLDPGSVKGIHFDGGALAKISGNVIHHLTSPLSKGIYLQPAGDLSNVTIKNNELTGLNINSGIGIETFVATEASLDLNVTDNTISNWQTGVLLQAENGATLEQSFQNNSVINNQTGFINENGTVVNATCNWWGHASGPGGAGPGTGNPVGPNVTFTPWATIENYVALHAGADQTIYKGYGPTSKTITPTITVCGTPTILWSTGATTAAITVNPAVTTTYSIKVTDANGHEATDEIIVFVQDARCGNNNNKVLICHNESTTKRKTLCIAASDVSSHLAHGDVLGDCAGTASKPSGSQAPGTIVNPEDVEKSFTILNVYPNPLQNQVELKWESLVSGSAKFSVIDVLGRTVFTQNLPQSKGVNYRNLVLPSLKNGNYIVMLQSGERTRTEKVFIQH